MDRISIIGIDAPVEFLDVALMDLKGLATIKPERLCRTRGLNLEDIRDDVVFVDPVLGIIICSSKKAEQLKSFGRKGVFETVEFIDELLLPLNEKSLPKDLAGTGLWYVDRLGGWPCYTGVGQSVAVIDSGIASAHPLLRRAGNHADFASSISLNRQTDDSRGHGTHCACVIAAQFGEETPRFSVAPNCQLSVGQVGSSSNVGVIATFDFLTLVSWAIHCRCARVISFSLTFARKDVVKVAAPSIFSWVARRLRTADKALVFCAAGNDAGPIQEPAAAEWIVAVSAYANLNASLQEISPMLDHAGFAIAPAKEDFLLGPGFAITTTDYPVGVMPDWGGTSAACAFVAGVAALYFEAYPSLSVNQILEQMKVDAEPVIDKSTGRCWKGVRFPGALPKLHCPPQP